MLKPVSGIEPRLLENLVSFCEQDYPEYQIVFGIVGTADPAMEVIRQVIARYPERDLAFVHASSGAGTNPKIANLAHMLGAAKHDLLVIADSDICVGRQYLNAVASPFRDVRVAGATCLYKGMPQPGLASALGAMFINDGFAPSVLVALTLGRLRYCFGATMAVQKSALLEIGGFAVLADQLADDYLLGKMLSDRGYKVALVADVVETTVHEPTLNSLLRHELRWARTVRAVRPVGYTLSFIAHPLALSIAYLLIGPRLTWGLEALAASATLRVVLHYAMRARFRISGRATPWLIPLRDMLSFAVWAVGLFGSTVSWRDRDFIIDADGCLIANDKP